MTDEIKSGESKSGLPKLSNEEIVCLYVIFSRLVKRFHSDRENKIKSANAMLKLHDVMKDLINNGGGDGIAVRTGTVGPDGDVRNFDLADMGKEVTRQLEKLKNSEHDIPKYVEFAKGIMDKYEPIYKFIEESGDFTELIKKISNGE